MFPVSSTPGIIQKHQRIPVEQSWPTVSRWGYFHHIEIPGNGEMYMGVLEASRDETSEGKFMQQKVGPYKVLESK